MQLHVLLGFLLQTILESYEFMLQLFLLARLWYLSWIKVYFHSYRAI